MTLTTLPPYKSRALPQGELAFREAGEGAPLVLIHGVGMQSAAWEPQISALSASHHVIALDMPGHGGSSPLATDAQLVDFIDWLDNALRALKLQNISLAGHSMGALIAGGYAATHPERLDRVALLNGVYCRDQAARNAVIARADMIRSGGFDLETPLTRWFSNSPMDLSARSRVARWLSEVDIDGYATAYGAFARGDATYAKRFADIPCPLLALTGDGDRNSTPSMSQAMADTAPNGRAMVIEGHRHMVNLTAPEAVNAALTGWLKTALKGETS